MHESVEAGALPTLLPGGRTVDDAAAALVDKLVRRNPHVFGDATAETLEEIEAQWQAIKAQEKTQD
mgnify:CR=1 FL=1